MKEICRICDLLSLLCFLLVTKPLIGYSLLQSTTLSRTASVNFRRNEERQQIHGNESRCCMDYLGTAVHAQRRSDQNVQAARTLPIQAFSTHRRLPVKERPIPSRQEISQLLRPPAPVSINKNTNIIYFTTPSPILVNNFHKQAFRPASPNHSEFKPPKLPPNAVTPVNSVVHKTSIASTTATPAISLGSYSTDSHHPHTQKKTHPLSYPLTTNSHTSVQHGEYLQSSVVSIPRPVNSNQPPPQQRPPSLKPSAPVITGNSKESHSTNLFQHVKVHQIIPIQISTTLSPPKIASSKEYVNLPQTDYIKRETYHVIKPVVENSSDSIQNVPLKADNDQKPSQQKRQDLKLSGNELGYFYPGAQTADPLGQFGLGPYGLDMVRFAEHHTPIANSFLINSMLNPALGLGLKGVGNVAPYHYGAHLYGADPIVSLLLKQYGKYLPYGLGSYGIYSYSAPSNIENSKPFGLYKYEDRI